MLSRQTLHAFWVSHADAEEPLVAWYNEAKKSIWEQPSDIKARYPSASFLANSRVVFNIKGNTYRLVVHVRYHPPGIVYIRFVGTHADYNRVDASKV